MHDRVTLGFDGSRASHSALRWAAAEAELRGAALRIVMSYSIPPAFDFSGVGAGLGSTSELSTLEEHAVMQLAAAAETVAQAHPLVVVDVEAVNEQAATVLVDASRHADLLVVANTGLGAVKEFLLGSVTGELLHASACPVAVVQVAERSSTSRIVVGIDGSPQADHAVRWATDEAARRSADLVILHAWEYPYRLTSEGLARGRDIARVDAALVVEDAVRSAHERSSISIEGSLVEGGATSAMVDASASADLVVIGSRGRDGFRSMLLGSVAHAVAVHATCPVVVLRSLP